MKSKLMCIVIIVVSFISGYFTCFSIKQNQVDKKVNDITLEGTFQDERFDKISLYDNLLYYYYVVDGEKMSTKTSLKKINKIVYTFYDSSIPFDMLIIQEKYIILMDSSSKNSVYFKKVFKYASFEEK
ncbi:MULTISPECIES: hypothetical protein [Faecalibacillus]|jgi:hypothetical protein|uniref:hypothetical protein n=1 Tax=Faecalibacillus TaxID=2678885 RepID=UPI000E5246C8|nr:MULTISPECIES: hypothetical protein [Faecalibacillus]RGF57655.1 hypothetical protein DWZ88_10085 [Coprobacillus sp. AF36-10BH]RGT62247.1 hypothetical protein DWX19_06445 [Coprobacillus sp. AF18-40]RHB08029.1 hypothetical protein DW906_00405 [Coprobacillus sp. AM42-12AC]RHH08203.1 hypothetical protein DW226_09825 [Coprobacillus sp. AM18-4LB-d2]RHP27608.1 hypothetical protein DWZ66_01185 [Coprobacillus sp. AF34-1BH]RHQ88321.1 hypothetical protein DWX89_02205 [Coprobacillus sp. AF21-8LB]